MEHRLIVKIVSSVIVYNKNKTHRKHPQERYGMVANNIKYPSPTPYKGSSSSQCRNPREHSNTKLPSINGKLLRLIRIINE